jgi:hypothetical protein
MRRFAFDRGLAGAAVLLALAAPARSQDEGVKQVEQLVKKAGATVEAIAGARAQLVKTMDVYNGLMVNEVTTDRKGAYKKLQQEMATTDKRRADIRTRADEMKVGPTRSSRAGATPPPPSPTRRCASAARTAWRGPRRAAPRSGTWPSGPRICTRPS